MQMLGENWQPLRNDTEMGPLAEGQLFVSYCEARAGRPKPNVKWYLHGKPLAGESQFCFVFLFFFFSLHFHLIPIFSFASTHSHRMQNF